MDLESTFETVLSSLPEDMDEVLSTVTAYIPEEVGQLLSDAKDYVPTEIDLAGIAQFLLYFAAASLILGLMSRIFLGKRSSLNHSLSSSMGILFVYAAAIVIYTFNPWELDALLSPLPFVRFTGEYLIVIPFQGTDFTVLCSEILSLVILAFLVNLLDSFMPRGKTILGWYLLRFMTVILSMLLHILADWAFKTYLPGVLVTYAPTILLILLICMLLMGLLNLVLSVVLTVVNPIFGAMYTFFFSNAVGKQLSKAIFSTGIICAVVFLMGYFGYTIICISAASLLAYIPLICVLLILWYLIGHVL